MLLAAWQGRSRDALWLIEEIVSDMDKRGRGFGVSGAHYAASVLHNGLGQYEDALASAELAVSHPEDLGFANLALAELIEAAVRSGRPERAAAAQQRLTALTQPSGTAWGLGVAARCRALLSEGDIAERQYQEAITRLGAAPASAVLARAHLLYGEWLRSEDRRGEARKHLQVAHGMLQEMEIGTFGDRARQELAAASGARRAERPPRIPSVGDALTEQEAQIARLAQAGLSNPEIGTRLFISARAVQYHLGKVFTKLGITSRSQLQWALSRSPGAGFGLGRPHRRFDGRLGDDELAAALAWKMVVPPAIRGTLLSRDLDGSDVLARTSVPVLVSHGRDDMIVLPSMAERTLTACPAATASCTAA